MTQVEREEYLALDSLGLLSDSEKKRVRFPDWETAREAFDNVVEHLGYLPTQTMPSPHLKKRILAALEARGSSRGGHSRLPLLMAAPFGPT